MRGSPRPVHGFTIVELIVVITLLGTVLAIIARIALSMQRGYVQQRALAQAEATARAAETAVATAFAGARANPYVFTTGELPRVERLAAGVRIVGDFNPADGRVDGLFEDISATVESGALRVRWQAPTTTASAVVASPVTSVTYTFYDATNAIVGASVGLVPATARQVRIVVIVPTQVATTPTYTRERWVYLRNGP